jgi:hypothetical protein
LSDRRDVTFCWWQSRFFGVTDSLRTHKGCCRTGRTLPLKRGPGLHCVSNLMPASRSGGPSPFAHLQEELREKQGMAHTESTMRPDGQAVAALIERRSFFQRIAARGRAFIDNSRIKWHPIFQAILLFSAARGIGRGLGSPKCPQFETRMTSL